MRFNPFVRACLGGFLLISVCPTSWAEPLLGPDFFEMIRVVEDLDGQTNVRSGPTLTSKVVGKVPSGGVVAIEESTTDQWTKLLTVNADDPPRYIHASRLKSVSKWKEIRATDAKDENLGVLKQGRFEARVTATPFVASQHQVTRDNLGQTLVDGKHPWGQDGGLPVKSLGLSVALDGKSIAIPGEATQDLYEPNMEQMALLTPGDPADHVLLVMFNSDGAGFYLVIWAFQKGNYCGRLVCQPF